MVVLYTIPHTLYINRTATECSSTNSCSCGSSLCYSWWCKWQRCGYLLGYDVGSIEYFFDITSRWKAPLNHTKSRSPIQHTCCTVRQRERWRERWRERGRKKGESKMEHIERQRRMKKMLKGPHFQKLETVSEYMLEMKNAQLHWPFCTLCSIQTRMGHIIKKYSYS